jgi:hypothetical protein
MKPAHKWLLVGAIALMVALYLLLPAATHKREEAPFYPHGKLSYLIDKILPMERNFTDVRATAMRMIITGTNPDDLDFTLPGEPGHGLPNKNNSVFGLEGGGAPWQTLPQEIFDGEPRYVFTGANKIPTIGTDAPEIIFIAWPINKDICDAISGPKKNGEEEHVLANLPDLTPFHSETGRPITELELNLPKDPFSHLISPLTCAQDKNGVRYYFHTIVDR